MTFWTSPLQRRSWASPLAAMPTMTRLPLSRCTVCRAPTKRRSATTPQRWPRWMRSAPKQDFCACWLRSCWNVRNKDVIPMPLLRAALSWNFVLVTAVCASLLAQLSKVLLNLLSSTASSPSVCGGGRHAQLPLGHRLRHGCCHRAYCGVKLAHLRHCGCAVHHRYVRCHGCAL